MEGQRNPSWKLETVIPLHPSLSLSITSEIISKSNVAEEGGASERETECVRERHIEKESDPSSLVSPPFPAPPPPSGRVTKPAPWRQHHRCVRHGAEMRDTTTETQKQC